MSLAATGASGGMGGGGAGLSAAAMAHGGPSGMTLHQHARPPPGSHAHHGPPGAAGVSAPGNLAALGADLVDKSQQLSLKAVRGVAGLPLVAVDLYGEGGEVAFFPPVPRDDDDEDDPAAAAEDEGPLEVRTMGKVGATGTDLVIKTDDDAAHRAIRKLLTKGYGYSKVFSDSLSDDDAKGDGGSARIVRPHLLLGARRTSEVHPSVLSRYTIAESDPAAIAEDAARTGGGASATPVTVRDSTLDGISPPRGDDFDRVAFGLAVHSKKKSLAVLPEEAVGIVIARSKRLVHDTWSRGRDVDPDDEGSYTDLPAAVSVPGWACRDASMEALLEAAGDGAAVYQRPVAACAGALLPNAGSGHHRLLQMVGQRMARERKERERRAAVGEDGPTGEYRPTIVMAGMTSDGVELTALQLGHAQDMDEVDGLAPFGDIAVLSSVCYQSDDPITAVKGAMKELVEEVDMALPELFDDDGGPVAIITYGTIPHQLKMKDETDKILKSYRSKGVSGWDDSIPHLSTREECVASGTALLAGISHGRVFTVESGGGKGSKKHRARPGILVQNASCCAVGVRYNYFGGAPDRWTPVKTVFDFGRRVPAGPYEVDVNAAEAAALRAAGGGELDEEKLLGEAKRLSGAKNIPKREEAALAMRVQVVQRSDRGGGWIKVGNPMMPLTIVKDDDDDDGGKEEDESNKGPKEKVACESSVLELSLNPVGIITTSLISDGKSVVQATKAARSSALQYYLGIAAAVLFFGGFLVKSYVEEAVFERDTRRVLAYYRHAAPGTINDGDERNARYLVWKYKGKKDKLWRRLEAKYGVPVRNEHEWDDDDEAQEEEEEEQDLDEKEKGKEEGEGEEKGGEEKDL